MIVLLSLNWFQISRNVWKCISLKYSCFCFSTSPSGHLAAPDAEYSCNCAKVISSAELPGISVSITSFRVLTWTVNLGRSRLIVSTISRHVSLWPDMKVYGAQIGPFTNATSPFTTSRARVISIESCKLPGTENFSLSKSINDPSLIFRMYRFDAGIK